MSAGILNCSSCILILIRTLVSFNSVISCLLFNFCSSIATTDSSVYVTWARFTPWAMGRHLNSPTPIIFLVQPASSRVLSLWDLSIIKRKQLSKSQLLGRKWSWYAWGSMFLDLQMVCPNGHAWSHSREFRVGGEVSASQAQRSLLWHFLKP